MDLAERIEATENMIYHLEALEGTFEANQANLESFRNQYVILKTLEHLVFMQKEMVGVFEMILREANQQETKDA